MATRERPAPSPAVGKELTPAEAAQERRNYAARLIKEYEGDLARVMPKHTNAEAFVGLALAYVRRDPKLLEAVRVNPQSLVLALRECAALGHMPQRGTYALVPFNDKHAPGGKSIVGIEEYRAVIERMYRAGAVQSVKCEVVRENDRDARWQPWMSLPRHEFDEYASDEERGPLKAVYAWAVMSNGALSQVAWMNRAAVMKRRAVSRSGDAFWGGPWEEDMWKKTALHHLERYVPTSSEYRWEVAASEANASTGFRGTPDVPTRHDMAPPDDGVLDAEILDETPPQTAARPVSESPHEGADGGGVKRAAGTPTPGSKQDDWPATARPGAGAKKP